MLGTALNKMSKEHVKVYVWHLKSTRKKGPEHVMREKCHQQRIAHVCNVSTAHILWIDWLTSFTDIKTSCTYLDCAQELFRTHCPHAGHWYNSNVEALWRYSWMRNLGWKMSRTRLQEHLCYMGSSINFWLVALSVSALNSNDNKHINHLHIPDESKVIVGRWGQFQGLKFKV